MSLNQLSSGLKINQPPSALTVTATQAAQTAVAVVQQAQATVNTALQTLEQQISQIVQTAASQGSYNCTVDVSPVTTLNKTNPAAAQAVLTQLIIDLNGAGFAFPPISFGTAQVILDWSAQAALQQANQTQQQVLTLLQ